MTEPTEPRYGEFPLRGFLDMQMGSDDADRLVATADGTFTTFSL